MLRNSAGDFSVDNFKNLLWQCEHLEDTQKYDIIENCRIETQSWVKV